MLRQYPLQGFDMRSAGISMRRVLKCLYQCRDGFLRFRAYFRQSSGSTTRDREVFILERLCQRRGSFFGLWAQLPQGPGSYTPDSLVLMA